MGTAVDESCFSIECDPDSLRDPCRPLRIDGVRPGDGYGLCQVLSTALDKMIIGMRKRRWPKLSGEGVGLDYSLSGASGRAS